MLGRSVRRFYDTMIATLTVQLPHKQERIQKILLEGMQLQIKLNVN